MDDIRAQDITDIYCLGDVIGYGPNPRECIERVMEAAGDNVSEAARRSEGLDMARAPFVLQTALGDFAATYEINAYCDDPRRIPQLYSALHANIQDVFNEHGVQIMSPAYVADPDLPKVVPPDRWYAAPAQKPE